jgi:hypothetical protein
VSKFSAKLSKTAEEKAVAKAAAAVRRREKLKAEVFKHYGEKCAHCGINDLDVLTIGHINQDGAEHRKKLTDDKKSAHRGRMSGYKFYQWLRANKYPPGFRVLCFNCNVKAFKQRR